MNKITEFFNKWGATIMTFLGLMIFLNTCGVKNRILVLQKRTENLIQTIQYNDSISELTKNIELQINNLKTERSTLHNMNEIVLKNIRPADRILQIDNQLDELNKQLKEINN